MPFQTQSSEYRSTESFADAAPGYGDTARDSDDYEFGFIIHSPVTSPAYLAFKRAFDLCVILLISPFIVVLGLIIAIAVYVDSPGPVFFSHRRIQRGGRYFSMWKFRTMCQKLG